MSDEPKVYDDPAEAAAAMDPEHGLYRVVVHSLHFDGNADKSYEGTVYRYVSAATPKQAAEAVAKPERLSKDELNRVLLAALANKAKGGGK